MNRLPVSRAVLALVAGTASAACGDASADLASTARDSAGIRIVESAAPAWKEGQAWTVSAEPTVDIGQTEGEVAYQLDEVVGALRLEDGRIVVANRGSGELRFFDAAGRHLASAGGVGGGPGEFRRMEAVHRTAADSLLAFDAATARLSVFAPEGRFARSVPVALDSGIPHWQGRLADGSLLVRADRSYGMEAKTGVLRDSLLLWRLDAAGAAPRRVGRFPGMEMFVRNDGRTMSLSPLAFGRTTEVVTDGDGFWVATAEREEVARYTADGRLQRLVRRPTKPRAVTPADVDALIDAWTAMVRSPEGREMVTRQFSVMPIPKTLPPYAGLTTDRDGRLWLREFRLPAEQARGELWTVFDRDGRMLGTVATPGGLRVTEIGADYVLGVWKDEDDVEHVRLHRLVKPATS